MKNSLDPEQVLQNVVTTIFTPLYQLAVGIAVVYFLYGALRFIIDMNDPERKNIGKEHLFWGTIGLFIIFSVGGVLRLFSDIFGGFFVY
jgi:hypothetical protein